MGFSVTSADVSIEATVKERLDALASPVRFFRDYDEPNEIFAPRLIDYLQQQILAGRA